MVVVRSLSRLSGYSLSVLRERARLALQDPVGELEAVRQLDIEQAAYNVIAADVELARRRVRRPVQTSVADSTQDRLRAILPMGQRGMATCPAHEDQTRSLSWRRKPDGFIVVKCHAGCSWPEIRAVL